MQRPSDEMFENIQLAVQFKNRQVSAIFNLTEPGEHPYCGHGNIYSSGFSYNPERFMEIGG